MSTRTIQLSEAVYQYMLTNALREPPLLYRLRKETADLPRGEMQISPEQGQLMRLLVELAGVRRALEIGTFTGYSALCVALALPADGRLICCDINAEWTAIAKRYWQEAGVAERIELRLAPALQTLDALLSGGDAATFDFAFIDADRGNARNYYERVIELLRPGGLVGVDNALRHGLVADAATNDPDTVAIRDLNRHVFSDERVTPALVPIGDGLLLARKR